MKKFVKFVAGIFCLAFCFLLASCTENKSEVTTNLPPPSPPIESQKQELVCIALYVNVTDNDFDAKQTVLEHLSVFENKTFKSGNNFIKVINFSSDKNIHLTSDTKIKYSTAGHELKIAAEVFLETKSAYAYFVTSSENGISAEFMGTITLENSKPLEYETNLGKINKILVIISTDITTTDKYEGNN